MKVLLLQDIKGTGKKDAIIEVSEGYGRNYLLPRKLAVEATKDVLNSMELSKQAAKHREEVAKNEAEIKARELKGKVIQLRLRGGENGKLYGSVTNEQIASALKAQYGIDVDKRKVEPEEAIKQAGQYTCTLRLNAGITAKMLLNVVVEGK